MSLPPSVPVVSVSLLPLKLSSSNHVLLENPSPSTFKVVTCIRNSGYVSAETAQRNSEQQGKTLSGRSQIMPQQRTASLELP